MGNSQTKRPTANSVPTPAAVLLDFETFSRRLIRILTKQMQVKPLRFNRAQRHYLAQRTDRDIILKSRQLGFSTLIQAGFFHDAVTTTCRTLTLAHVDETTQALRRMADFFYNNIPAPFPKPLRMYANASITTYADTNSESAIGTAGGQGVGRGFTFSKAHLSEVAFWKDARTVIAGLMQAIPDRGSIVIESTPNGQSGYFYDTCMEALRGEGEWRLHFYPWWWADEYALPLERGERLILTDEEQALARQQGLSLPQIKWRRHKMAELKDLFLQEYPEDPQTCFLSNDAAAVFKRVRERATASVPESAAAYRQRYPKSRFVMGVDWGRENDWTVCTVIDAVRWHVVSVLRVRHLDWHIQRARLKVLASEWGCERIIAERNSVGDVNISALKQDGLTVQSFLTTQKSKKVVIDNLALALEEGDIALLPAADPNGAIMLQELVAFQQTRQPGGDYKYEGRPHDDCVMSLSLALFGVKQLRG